MSDIAAQLFTVFTMIVTLLINGYFGKMLFFSINTDASLKICEFVDWGMWWRYCLSIHIPLQFKNVSNVKYINTYLSKIISSMNSLSCADIIASTMDTIIVGSSIVAFCGLTILIGSLVRTLYQNYVRGARDIGITRNILVSIVWACGSLSTNRSMGRFAFWFGIAACYREIYNTLLVRGRKIAQTLGENILEPSANQSYGN
jgi:hypothetical protein